jgi:4'-phosphopantetheinyl transferase
MADTLEIESTVRVDLANAVLRLLETRLFWPPAPLKTALRPGEADVWAFPLDVDPARLADYCGILSSAEQERAERFRFERDRTRYITAHAVLRQILARYLASDAGELHFGAGPRGKPFLAGPSAGSPLHFNLSHSGHLGMAVVSCDRPVGVDVEALRPLADAADLVARFFSSRERDSFEQLPEHQQTAAFFNLWTRKEAWLKATGEGISESLRLVEVSFVPGDEARFVALPEWAAALGQWRLWALEPAVGFVGAAALPVDSRLRCWSWNDL